MRTGEILATDLRASLVENRGSLRRWLAQMDARNGNVLTGMSDGMHRVGMGEDALLPRSRTTASSSPASLPKFVADFQIFFCQIVAIVMAGMGRLTDIERA
jgi:hypothetical protein